MNMFGIKSFKLIEFYENAFYMLLRKTTMRFNRMQQNNFMASTTVDQTRR